MCKLGEAPLVKEILLEKLREQILPLRSDSYIRIPSERTLSEQFSVSRLSIRAALKELTSEGLLVQMQGKGTYITPLVKMCSLSLIGSPDIKPNDPFYNKFLVEITNEAAKRSFNLNMVDIDKPVPGQSGSPLIIMGLLENSILESLSALYSPVITIQEYPWLQDITQISFDDYKIGCDAARILFEHNHTRILHLAGPEKYPSAFFRKKGLLDAAEKLGIHVDTITDKMNWAGGYKLGELYCQKLAKVNSPTAVFAANDWMAAGFMKRLQESGFSIPADISVLGCDNIPLSAEYSPAISTFDLDMRQLISEIFSVLEDSPTVSHGNSQGKSHTASPESLTKLTAPPRGKRIMLPATPILRKSIKKCPNEIIK